MIKGILWLSVINVYVKVINKIKKDQFISPLHILKRKSEGVIFIFKKLFLLYINLFI